VSYSDAAETDSVRSILLSARARSSEVIITEGEVAEVDDEVIAELIQKFVDWDCIKDSICKRTSPRNHKIP